ncbi:MAG: PEP-CTERM sorting domain-containing protein [Akkermansia sp.]|nr:PEP-CTERM sorting domain-containing protein [Akkermansia sp.]
MKKTLFAMAALALCGTAFAGEYYLSDYEGSGFFAFEPYGEGEAVVVNVNHTVDVSYFDTQDASSVTLNFVGANTSFSAEELYMPNLVSVMGDDAAKASWGETLLSSTGVGDCKSILLATAPDLWLPFPGEGVDPTLEGKSVGDLITLGNAEVTYLGYFNSSSEADVAIENYGAWYSDAVALVGDSTKLYLYGLATTAATPEPATATLSLLALAGMVTRRRRK